MFGHWEANFKIDKTKYGFVYVITNQLNGKKYIGCKVFWFRRGKKVKESDWASYQGSNRALQADIAKHGKDKFKFFIIKLCDSKQDLSYSEVKEIIAQNAIYSPEYYNEYVGLRLRNKKT